ncbi:MAG: type II toxin-antitoxin system ParD family antitoxin [Lysobacterales bacterium]
MREEVSSGRYSSASEVIRNALRELEDIAKQLESLRAHLAEGAEQAANQEFVKRFNIQDVIDRAHSRA